MSVKSYNILYVRCVHIMSEDEEREKVGDILLLRDAMWTIRAVV